MTAMLDEMTAEIERFKREHGLSPVRLEVGSACMRVLRDSATQPIPGSSAHLPVVAAFMGTPVYPRFDLDPREWAVVFRS